MKKLWALVLAGCIAVVLSTTAWASEMPTAWNGDSLTLTSGSYYLKDDVVTITNTLTITGDVTLDLDGKVLKMTGSGSVIKVESGGKLTLVDNNTEGKSHYFKVEDSGLWTLDETNGTKTVEGGVITGGTGYKPTAASFPTTYGGGVYVAPGASFVMHSGNIVGCSASNGGGVCVADDYSDLTTRIVGTFKMYYGTISGCTANRGGGLSNAGEAALYITSKIEFCRATGTERDDHGGGVYSLRRLTIKDNVEITGCEATESESAAMYVTNDDRIGTSSIEGGTFDGSVLFDLSGFNPITVSGGTFNDKVTFADNYGSSIVSGGTFNGDVSGANVVTFDTDGGSANPDKQVRANSKVNKPDDPTKEGYIFEGWYDGDVKFDFEQVVSGERAVTLKAKWTKEPVVEQPKYYYKASGSGETTETKGSPKTFDAGVGVYVGMAVLSVSGSAVVLRKKRK